MLAVLVVLLIGLVLALVAWAIAREMNLSRWAALAAAGVTFIATSGLGLSVLSVLSASGRA
jgi:hypothetical protein